MSKVLEPAEVSQEPAPTLEERIGKLSPEGHDLWQVKGLAGLEEAEKAGKLKPAPNSDVAAESSTATPAAPVKTEAAQTETDSGPDEEPKTRQDRNWAKLRKENAILQAKLELFESERAATRHSAPGAPKDEKKPDAKLTRPVLPKMKDHDTVEAYDSAMEAYDKAKVAFDEQELAARLEQRFQEKESQRNAETRQQTWAQQVTEEKQAFKDYEAVAFSDKTAVSDVMLQTMHGHKVGAKIAYYLGKHPEEALALATDTDLPGVVTPEDFRQFVKDAETDPKKARLLARAETIAEREFDRIAQNLVKPPAKTTPARPLPKATSEVSVEQRGSPVGDEEEEAVKSGNQAAFNAVRNRKDMERKGLS